MQLSIENYVRDEEYLPDEKFCWANVQYGTLPLSCMQENVLLHSLGLDLERHSHRYYTAKGEKRKETAAQIGSCDTNFHIHMQ